MPLTESDNSCFLTRSTRNALPLAARTLGSKVIDFGILVISSHQPLTLCRLEYQALFIITFFTIISADPHFVKKFLVKKSFGQISFIRKIYNYIYDSSTPYFRKPSTIFSSASCAVNPSVCSFINCSPAIFPIAASWIKDASK